MSSDDPRIRAFDPDTDLTGLRACFLELQDYERSLYPRIPPGEEVVDACISFMQENCSKCVGRIFVAEVDGTLAGFVTVLSHVISEEPDDGGLEYGLISDLVVMQTWRGRGLGRRLMETAEAWAREHGVEWLRIGVIASNDAAQSLYASEGFEPWYVEREKKLIKSEK